MLLRPGTKTQVAHGGAATHCNQAIAKPTTADTQRVSSSILQLICIHFWASLCAGPHSHHKLPADAAGRVGHSQSSRSSRGHAYTVAAAAVYASYQKKQQRALLWYRMAQQSHVRHNAKVQVQRYTRLCRDGTTGQTWQQRTNTHTRIAIKQYRSKTTACSPMLGSLQATHGDANRRGTNTSRQHVCMYT